MTRRDAPEDASLSLPARPGEAAGPGTDADLDGSAGGTGTSGQDGLPSLIADGVDESGDEYEPL